MKNLFKKTAKEEIEKVTDETEENTASVEKTEKKKTVPTWVKVAAAGAGVVIGAFGLSKIFGHGDDLPSDWSFDEDGDSEDSEETSESNSGSDTETSDGSAE